MRDRVKKALLLLVVGIAVNIALAIVKLYVGLSSNSLTIMLDSINSFFDIITCFVTVAAFGILLGAKRESVPYGYGRSEYLASFVVAVVSCVVGGLFFIRSLNRMAMPEPVWFGVESCVLISVTIPIKLGIGLWYHFANRKLRSKALEAIALDSFLDTAITSASLISFVVSSVVNYAVDAIFGMVLSVVIVVFAIRMVVDSVKSVIVGDVQKEDIERVKKAAADMPCVERVDSVCMHDYGYGEKTISVCVRVRKGTSMEDFDAQRREFVRNFCSVSKEEFSPELQLVPKLGGEDESDASASDMPAADAPADALVSDMPAADTFASDEFATEVPATDTPATNTLASDTPTSDIPDMSAIDTPASDADIMEQGTGEAK